jgi:glyoxylase-like metal-dependent hydrolase (beta-lactamase superfamily II)
MLRVLRAALLAGIAVAGTSHAADPLPPTPQALAPGIWWIPGSFPPDRQPDGNTLVYRGLNGLVVMDTGRHRWHRQAILDFVRAQRLPVTALVNSHWHLDHTSGNADILRENPGAVLYTGTAVERIARDVWPQSMARAEARLAEGKLSATDAEEVRGDLETRRDPTALMPGVAVTESGVRTIDGIALDVRLAPNAATDGDVWVYEPSSRIAASGDLVTLPVPFLDTACVAGWRDALDEIAATRFVTLVPGHGAPMNRPQFLAYRAAFEQYTGCANSTTASATCAADWAKATAALRAPEPADDARTLEMAGEYVDYLRENGGNARLCLVR